MFMANSYEFVKLLEGYQFGEHDRLLSFDIESLFTNVPVDDSLLIIESRLNEMAELDVNPIHQITMLTNRAIMRLLRWGLSQCYFSWYSVLYRQKSGLPMGGRLSPIIANIYMEELEHQVLTTSLTIPKLYFRYVDDVVVIWDESQGSYAPFLKALNDVHPDINLTVEEEQNGQLAFLDVSITRPKLASESSGPQPLQLAIHRKATHSDRYLKYHSSHPVPMKRTILRGMWLRGNRILKNHPKQLEQEMKHLKKVFSNENNGYPIDLILRWFGQFRRDLRAKPEILNVRSRLEFDDIFVLNSQQIFDFPTAAHRFQADISDVDLADSQLNLDDGLVDLDHFRPIDEIPDAHEADASGTRGGIVQDGLLYDVGEKRHCLATATRRRQRWVCRLRWNKRCLPAGYRHCPAPRCLGIRVARNLRPASQRRPMTLCFLQCLLLTLQRRFKWNQGDLFENKCWFCLTRLELVINFRKLQNNINLKLGSRSLTSSIIFSRGIEELCCTPQKSNMRSIASNVRVEFNTWEKREET